MTLTAVKRRQIPDRPKEPSSGSAFANGGRLLQSHEIPLPKPSPQVDLQTEADDVTAAIRGQERRAAGLPEPTPDRPAFPVGKSRRPNVLADLGARLSASRR